jgi:hypothetical protein
MLDGGGQASVVFGHHLAFLTGLRHNNQKSQRESSANPGGARAAQTSWGRLAAFGTS